MLNIIMHIHTYTYNLKGHKKTWGSDENVYYLDCGEDNKSVYMCSSSPICIY